MIKQHYDNEYLWKHPEFYQRLTSDDIRNRDAVVDLCEIVLLGIREEVEHIIDTLNHRPSNPDARGEARKMNDYLLSDTLSAMSFGGSVSLAEELRRKCPKGLFSE